MNPLQERWQALSMRVDNLTLRERLLVFVAVGAVVLAALYLGLIEPSMRSQTVMRLTTEALDAELAPLREQLAIAERAAQSDQDTELTRLAADISALEQEVQTLQGRMVTPAQASAQLRLLLTQQPSLALLELSAVAAPPAPATAPDPASPPQAKLSAPFYEHGITLRIAGNYADLTRYVGQLEQMPWAVRWEAVRIDATNHPALELTLKLVTLSREPTWSQL